jgi:hypothetical protein
MCTRAKEVNGAQECDGEESKRKQAGVDRHQPLAHADGKRHDEQSAHPEHGLSHRSRISHVDVSLVPPFLSALNDLMLGRSYELAATPRRAEQREDHGEGHARADNLAQDRRHAHPPWASAPDLRDDEPNPGRHTDHDEQNGEVDELPREHTADRGQEQQWVARQLDQHHRSHAVGEQVHGGLELDCRSCRTSQNGHQQFEGGLEAASRPAGLLSAIGVDRDRQLFRHDQVLQVCGTPAAQLRPVAQVQILGQGGGAPAARILYRRSPPDSRGAREVGEVTVRRSDRLLHEEVEVDRKRLQPREPRVALVQVTPSCLREADGWIIENPQRAAQEFPRRHEVRVEDCDEGRGRKRHAMRQRAGFEAIAPFPSDVRHVDSAMTPVSGPPGDD